MLEIGIDALGIDAVANEDNGEVVIQVVGGQQLPLAAPGTNEPLKIPSASITYSLTKDAALKFADLLKERAEELPDEKSSSILTANDLKGVEELARMQQALTNR
jgi:hypothetical protein